MNKKLYKREGRRFVPIGEDLTGQIREVEGTKAICVLQTPTTRYWAAIDDSNEGMTHYEAANYVKTQFNGKGMLPERSSLLLLRDKYREKINARDWYYWTADVCESASNYAWILRWSNGYMGNGNRTYNYYVRAFLVEKI